MRVYNCLYGLSSIILPNNTVVYALIGIKLCVWIDFSRRECIDPGSPSQSPDNLSMSTIVVGPAESIEIKETGGNQLHIVFP